MKVTCPRHEDDKPSCEIYETHAYCFAGCGSIPLSELGMQSYDRPYIPPEELQTKRSYIGTLPRKLIRGIEMPYDDRGYYIIWPDCDYYKLRLWEHLNPKTKYLNPKGHTQPPFWARRTWAGNTYLILIEGEINALSVAQALPEYDVCSPGSASDISSEKIKRYLKQFLPYSRILIVVDNDPAGVQAAIRLKGLLYSYVPYVGILRLDNDCNEILLHHGKEELRKTIKEALPSWLQGQDNK